jgi:hypothetical protein
LQPPKATHECNHKSPISNHVVLVNLHLYEPKILLDIFFTTLYLCVGYYWMSLKIHFGKAFESGASTLAHLEFLALGFSWWIVKVSQFVHEPTLVENGGFNDNLKWQLVYKWCLHFRNDTFKKMIPWVSFFQKVSFNTPGSSHWAYGEDKMSEIVGMDRRICHFVF